MLDPVFSVGCDDLVKKTEKTSRKVLTRGSIRVVSPPPHDSERRERRESIATRKGPIGFLVPSKRRSFTSMARPEWTDEREASLDF